MRVLVLGATGAMGRYVVPKLLERGYNVAAVSLDDMESNDKRLRYIKANATDMDVIRDILSESYDGIIDFMVYPTPKFAERFELILGNTSHYIYLSSYRVYANEEHPITENSPRLLEASHDKEFLATEDYSLYKARCENILRSSVFGNWTAVRPAVTYSTGRYQLVTLEANVNIPRAKKGLPVLVPESTLGVEATMSWAGDVAEMIVRLLFNEEAKREIYTVSTSEHHKWGEIAEYYREFAGLEIVPVDNETYLKCFSPDRNVQPVAKYQLEYDRMFDRIIDNTKILKATGMKQSELMPLKKGLEYELSRLPYDYKWSPTVINDNMDFYLKTGKL